MLMGQRFGDDDIDSSNVEAARVMDYGITLKFSRLRRLYAAPRAYRPGRA
jgi:hypothetical protein